MNDVKIIDFGSSPKKRAPAADYPWVKSLGFGSGPYPGPNGLVTCTQLDHSEYKESTNHWNALEWVEEKKECKKCGRPPYQEWFKAINWKSRDIEYWREIFRTAADAERRYDGGLPFFYLWESKRWAGERTIIGDQDYDPGLEVLKTNSGMQFRTKSVLTLLHQRYKNSWREQHGRPGTFTLAQHIRLSRYDHRRPKAKENRYLGFDSLLRMELDEMAKDLSCVDNYRVADVSKRKDMRRYRKQRDSGCCGSDDKEVSMMGRKFMIGINFGH